MENLPFHGPSRETAHVWRTFPNCIVRGRFVLMRNEFNQAGGYVQDIAKPSAIYEGIATAPLLGRVLRQALPEGMG
jgi:hypothetical protein